MGRILVPRVRRICAAPGCGLEIMKRAGARTCSDRCRQRLAREERRLRRMAATRGFWLASRRGMWMVHDDETLELVAGPDYSLTAAEVEAFLDRFTITAAHREEWAK